MAYEIPSLIPPSMQAGFTHKQAAIKRAKALAAAQEEGGRRQIEMGMASERKALMDAALGAAGGGSDAIGLTKEQQDAAKFLQEVYSGKTVPIDAQTRAAMLAQAQDPLAAEYAAAQTYNRNLYGNAGFGAGGGGETESMRQLRMATLQGQAQAGQQSLIAAANSNLNARLSAANSAAGLGNQANMARIAAIQAAGDIATKYPLTGGGGFYTPKTNPPITVQPSQGVTSF